MATSTYDEALRRLFVHEGGYSNHPSDPGVIRRADDKPSAGRERTAQLAQDRRLFRHVLDHLGAQHARE